MEARGLTLRKVRDKSEARSGDIKNNFSSSSWLLAVAGSYQRHTKKQTGIHILEVLH